MGTVQKRIQDPRSVNCMVHMEVEVRIVSYQSRRYFIRIIVWNSLQSRIRNTKNCCPYPYLYISLKLLALTLYTHPCHLNLSLSLHLYLSLLVVSIPLSPPFFSSRIGDSFFRIFNVAYFAHLIFADETSFSTLRASWLSTLSTAVLTILGTLQAETATETDGSEEVK